MRGPRIAFQSAVTFPETEQKVMLVDNSYNRGAPRIDPCRRVDVGFGANGEIQFVGATHGLPALFRSMASRTSSSARPRGAPCSISRSAILDASRSSRPPLETFGFRCSAVIYAPQYNC